MNGGPIGPKKTVTRYRWEMTPDEARVVATALTEAALDTDGTMVGINLDDLVARVAPDARKVAYEVPAAETTPDDEHPHYLWQGFIPPG